LCVKKVITDDTTGAKESAWEKVATEAQACYTAAGDDEAAQKACAMPMLFELPAEDCPDGFDTFKKACDIFSYEFEDFVLDLAEELEFESFAEELAEEISEELVDGELLMCLFLSAQLCSCMMYGVTVPRDIMLGALLFCA